MSLLEKIKLAFRAIKDNLLRAILTITIIAIGIMALVGIITATDSIKASLTSSFSSMGANTFTVDANESGGGMFGGRRKRDNPKITYEQTLRFKERYSYDAQVAISTMATGMATLKHGSEETNPNVQVFGVDQPYVATAGYSIAKGRNFTDSEINRGSPSAIIGGDVKNRLFKQGEAVGENIRIGNIRYRVIGVLANKGTSMTGAGDNLVLIPLNNARSNFTGPGSRFILSIMVDNPDLMEPAIGQARATLRNVRKVPVSKPDNFVIQKSDQVAEDLITNLNNVGYFAAIIGFVTLFGAAIALMNIMLVSVTERTREIGITKAIGAKRSTILTQFLTEAVVICQIGGLVGIGLGVQAGNGVSILLGSAFLIPWKWMIFGVVICFVVGVIAGFYPAIKASRLDPIEALRYE
jgi:putative ABC transport system permease protein